MIWLLNWRNEKIIRVEVVNFHPAMRAFTYKLRNQWNILEHHVYRQEYMYIYFPEKWSHLQP